MTKSVCFFFRDNSPLFTRQLVALLSERTRVCLEFFECVLCTRPYAQDVAQFYTRENCDAL